MSCKKVDLRKQKICIGDLKHQIGLYTRDIKPSNSGISRDYDYTLIANVWAGIKSVNGKVDFNGIATLENTTDYFYIRYRDDINSQVYVLYKDKYYNILETENIDENEEFLKLYCSYMGKDGKGALNW